jgi:hypothetical protein
MNKTPSENDRHDRSIWYMLFRRQLPLEAETTRFIFVSVLDFVLTYLLIRQSGFTEGNPIARYFLYGWGVRGMLYFKMAMVAFIAVLVQIIAAYRPETAHRLMNLATLVVTGVVLYSTTLLLRSYGYL